MQWISSPWALWPKNSIEILPKFDCQPMFFILFFILIAVLQLPILINLLLYFLTTITISSKQKILNDRTEWMIFWERNKLFNIIIIIKLNTKEYYTVLYIIII